MFNLEDHLITSVLVYLISNFKTLKTKTTALFKYNKEIRISFSYIYKIRIDNKYLLIKGNRIDQFQPIGGVYKHYPSYESKFTEFGLRRENEKGFYEEDDFRLIIKGKNINKFIDHFDSQLNREVSVHREFIEEIIDRFDFPIESLKGMGIEYLKSVGPKITYSDHFKIKELKRFDVYQLNLDDKYLKLLKELTEKESSLILASDEEIITENIVIEGLSRKIGQHAKHLL